MHPRSIGLTFACFDNLYYVNSYASAISAVAHARVCAVACTMVTVTSAMITIACTIVTIACTIVTMARAIAGSTLCGVNYVIPITGIYDTTDIKTIACARCRPGTGVLRYLCSILKKLPSQCPRNAHNYNPYERAWCAAALKSATS